MANNNKLIDIQEILMRQMKRLDDDKVMEESGTTEIARSNALSNQATTYLKSLNTQLRILETAKTNEQTAEALKKQIGL